MAMSSFLVGFPRSADPSGVELAMLRAAFARGGAWSVWLSTLQWLSGLVFLSAMGGLLTTGESVPLGLFSISLFCSGVALPMIMSARMLVIGCGSVLTVWESLDRVTKRDLYNDRVGISVLLSLALFFTALAFLYLSAAVGCVLYQRMDGLGGLALFAMTVLGFTGAFILYVPQLICEHDEA